MMLPPPITTFTSPGGRVFTVDPGEHEERWEGDPLWNDIWPILYEGNPAGKLIQNTSYGRTSSGQPRWQATTRELFWTMASDAPTGVGFDVSAFDTAEETVAAWARSADQVFDWAEGKPVHSIYSKTGVYQKVLP